MIAMGSTAGTVSPMKLSSVPESVIGLDRTMKARPLPEGDCACRCTSCVVSCLQLMFGVIASGMTGLQVKWHQRS